jgi:hypothetical protein
MIVIICRRRSGTQMQPKIIALTSPQELLPRSRPSIRIDGESEDVVRAVVLTVTVKSDGWPKVTFTGFGLTLHVAPCGAPGHDKLTAPAKSATLVAVN